LEEFQKKVLNKEYSDKVKACTDENPSNNSRAKRMTTNNEQKQQKASQGKQRFHSVKDITTRRQAMNKFLMLYKIIAACFDFETAACNFVKFWYDRTRRLIL
jgi:hypothetical protein